jgi:hypothetical protein
MARVMLRSICNRGESGRVYSGSPRRCGEIMFGFASAGLYEESILHAGFERISGDAFEGGVHAWDRCSVSKFLNRHGIRFGNKMPNSMRKFIGGHVAQWDDFDGLELEFCIKIEQHGISGRIGGWRATAAKKTPLRTGAMRNMNILLHEPVSIQVEREAAEQTGQCKQHPLLFRHTPKWLT